MHSSMPAAHRVHTFRKVVWLTKKGPRDNPNAIVPIDTLASRAQVFFHSQPLEESRFGPLLRP